MNLPFEINQDPETLAAVAVVSITIALSIFFILRFSPRRLRPKRFSKKWKELQAKCADPERWPDVLKEADDLLDEALKRRRIKGKTMGERMVKAQKLFTDNDSVWFGHKLRKKYENKPDMQLTRDQMKKALIGLGRALKDLGALRK